MLVEEKKPVFSKEIPVSATYRLFSTQKRGFERCLEVDEKIDALAAYSRFPDYRLEIDDNGKLTGNIIVDADGARSPLDEHHRDNEQAFERRVQNYIVGKNAVVMETPQEVERSRSETLTNLAKIFDQPPANRVIDLLGRWRRLDAKQVSELIAWLQGIKSSV